MTGHVASTKLTHHWPSENGDGASMTDRLQQIREAVVRDGANLEDAYADRAWLLAEVERLGRSISDVTTERDRLKEDLSAARRSLYEVAAQRNELHAIVEKLSINAEPQA